MAELTIVSPERQAEAAAAFSAAKGHGPGWFARALGRVASKLGTWAYLAYLWLNAHASQWTCWGFVCPGCRGTGVYPCGLMVDDRSRWEMAVCPCGRWT